MPQRSERNLMNDTPGRIFEKYGKSLAEKIPVAIPILLEVGADLATCLVENKAKKLHPDTEQAIKKMREDFQDQFGVKIPAVHVRETKGAQDEYTIEIYENVVERGMVSKRGNEILLDLIEKLRSVIAQNLGQLFGVAEAARLLELEVYKFPEAPHTPRYREILDDAWMLGKFTQILRRLVREQVPINNLYPIVTEFLRATKDGLDLIQIIEDIRALPEIRETLPGNNLKSDFIETVPELEHRIQIFMRDSYYLSKLVLDLDHVEYISNLLRAAIHKVSNPAIIVTDPKIRPYFRDFLDAEFHYVPVLAWRELRPELQSQIHQKLNWGAEQPG